MNMPQILNYARSRATMVEQIDKETIRSECILQDTLSQGSVAIKVKLPDLEIIEAIGKFQRSFKPECNEIGTALEKIIGVRVGPGMLKIIPGLLKEKTSCKQLSFMVEECCHGVILAFTKDTLLETPAQLEGSIKFYQKMVKKNIRLYNRCAAFAKGSKMVEGIDGLE